MEPTEEVVGSNRPILRQASRVSTFLAYAFDVSFGPKQRLACLLSDQQCYFRRLAKIDDRTL
jgi:hypothetical protein